MNKIIKTACLVLGLSSFAVSGGICATENLVVHHAKKEDASAVLRWDCPVFVSYADGTIIWRKNWENDIGSFYKIKCPNQREALKEMVTTILPYNGKVYPLTDSTDPEITIITVGTKSIEINGDWEKSRSFHSDNVIKMKQLSLLNEEEKKLWSTLPSQIRQALQSIKYFSDSRAEKWFPEFFTVTFERGGANGKTPRLIPEEWLAISNIDAEGNTVVKLPGKMFEPVMKIVQQEGVAQPIAFGREIKYARIAFVFPNLD